MSKITNIIDVAENHLCCGCGVCAFLCPDSVEMVDDIQTGRRPVWSSAAVLPAAINEQLLSACPGMELNYKDEHNSPEYIDELVADWGPIREILEGYAADQGHRHAGSSGGVASTVALFGIERRGLHGVLHIAARSDIPYLNETVLSTTREQIISRMGSRYAPASPCDGLQMILDAPTPCVIIGKPCDIAAIHKARKIRPELDKKVGLTISIFCAATPSTAGTLAVMKHLGVNDNKSVRHIRYRGNGWPGNARVEFNSGGEEHVKQMSYADSWGKILCHYRQWRCNLCVDHTGEFADISVGDPWYREVETNDPGRSLILARSTLGQKILKEAVAEGYLTLEETASGVLAASQPSLLNIRRSVWGRLFALRIAGAATPRIHDVPMFRLWLRLSLRQKISSILGTFKRIYLYKLRKIQKIIPLK